VSLLLRGIFVTCGLPRSTITMWSGYAQRGLQITHPEIELDARQRK